MYTLQTKLKIFYANAINEKRRKYETTRLGHMNNVTWKDGGWPTTIM